MNITLNQIEVDSMVRQAMLAEGSIDCQAFETNDGLGVLYSVDKTPKGVLKHLSISRLDRYPHWDEILKIKEHFFGDVDAMMVMPKKSDYVNIHRNCFHVWETPTEWDIL